MLDHSPLLRDTVYQAGLSPSASAFRLHREHTLSSVWGNEMEEPRSYTFLSRSGGLSHEPSSVTRRVSEGSNHLSGAKLLHCKLLNSELPSNPHSAGSNFFLQFRGYMKNK